MKILKEGCPSQDGFHMPCLLYTSCGYLAGLCMAPSLTADAQISAQAGKTAQTVVSRCV